MVGVANRLYASTVNTKWMAVHATLLFLLASCEVYVFISQFFLQSLKELTISIYLEESVIFIVNMGTLFLIYVNTNR